MKLLSLIIFSFSALAVGEGSTIPFSKDDLFMHDQSTPNKDLISASVHSNALKGFSFDSAVKVDTTEKGCFLPKEEGILLKYLLSREGFLKDVNGNAEFVWVLIAESYLSLKKSDQEVFVKGNLLFVYDSSLPSDIERSFKEKSKNRVEGAVYSYFKAFEDHKIPFSVYRCS